MCFFVVVNYFSTFSMLEQIFFVVFQTLTFMQTATEGTKKFFLDFSLSRFFLLVHSEVPNKDVLTKSGHGTHFNCKLLHLQSWDEDSRLKQVPCPLLARFLLCIIVLVRFCAWGRYCACKHDIPLQKFWILQSLLMHFEVLLLKLLLKI